MRTYIFVCLQCIVCLAFAQDRLAMTDGQTIQVWITEVGDNYVKYIHADKDEGTEYNLPKRMVAKVIYASGEVATFSEPEQQSNPGSDRHEPTVEIKNAESQDASVAITSVNPESSSPVRIDIIELMNGGSIEALVSEINDQYIEYVVGENTHQIPVSEINGITFSDGTYEQFYEEESITDVEVARKTSQEYRKRRQEIQQEQDDNKAVETNLEPEPAVSSSSKPFSLRINRGDKSNVDKDQPHKDLVFRLVGGLNLITGIGTGKRDLNWALQLSEADLAPGLDVQSSGSWQTTAGIHLGLMTAYGINPHINLIGGLQVSQKGFITLQTLSFEERETSNRWLINIREREQMVHLDIPIGIEGRILPMLECQAGIVGSVVVKGSTFVTTDTDVFDATGSRIEAGTGTESQRQIFNGVALAPGGFLGIRVPFHSQLAAHLRMIVNTGGGYDGAFANTVVQLGVGYRL